MTDDTNTTIESAADNAAPKLAPLPRQVGFGLGMGILLAPIIFVWFLLREGHSATAQFFGFAWLALTLVFAFLIHSPPSFEPKSEFQSKLDFSTPNVTSDEPVVAPTQSLPRVGEPIEVGPLVLTFEAPSIRSAVGMQGMRESASEGGVLVVVRYTMKNASRYPVEAYELPQITMVDPRGVTYGPDAGKTAMFSMETNLDQKLWSNLNPGITTRSAQVFEISEDSFDPATWRIVIGDTRILVALD